MGGRTYAPDTLLGIGLDAFLHGDRDVHRAVHAAPRRALQIFGWVGGSLLVSVLDELRPVFQLVEPGAWTSRTLDGLPPVGTACVWALDRTRRADGTLLARVQDPLTPPTLLLIPPGPAAPAILKRTPPRFDAPAWWSPGTRRSPATASASPTSSPARRARRATRRCT